MSDLKTWGYLRREAKDRLEAGGFVGGDQEAQWLVEEVSGMNSAELIASAKTFASVRATEQLDTLLERRLIGEPLQYVLGSWSFRGIDLMVDRRVLIPRPETETLVGLALIEAQRMGLKPGEVVVDLGTGSGAIAIGLAAQLFEAAIWATDVDSRALEVARANVAARGRMSAGIQIVQGSWFDALPHELSGRVRLVVSNPPYIAEDEIPELPPEVIDYEPFSALVSGPTGSEHIETILLAAQDWLADDGVVLIELDPRRAKKTHTYALSVGFAGAVIENDLTGQPRVLIARR